MSKRVLVSATNGGDANGAWQTEVRCKRRKYAEEHIRRASGSWMYSSDPIVDNTLHWIKGGAFIECQSCGPLGQQSLNEHVESKNNFKKTTENCITCSTGVHYVPQPEDVPDVLRGLTRATVLPLRPVELHCGTIVRGHRNGYRQSTKPVCLSVGSLPPWRRESTHWRVIRDVRHAVHSHTYWKLRILIIHTSWPNTESG